MALALAALAMPLVGGRPPSAAGQASGAGPAAVATNGRITFVLGNSTGKCKGRFGDLATANPDGSQCRVLTKGGDAEFPSVNPAGDTIAFTLVHPPAPSSIYVIGINGTGKRQLVSGPASEPAWSPDGSEIAFAGGQSGSSQIYVADADTGAILAQLTTGPGNNSEPAWSPDGTEIAFISDRGGSNRLYVMQADGADQQPLTEDAGVDSDPTWSPDSQHIAFANDQLAPPAFQIYQIDVDGTGELQVTHDALNDQNPTWSPDGRLIAFTSYSGTGTNTIRLVPAPDASGAGALPHFPGEQSYWAPLPAPSKPGPGLTVNATPHGQVQIQPGGSSLVEPLNGSVSVPVAVAAPTIFRPGPGANVTLETRTSGGASRDITISKGPVEVSQPAGQRTQIRLMGGASSPCPASTATSDNVSPSWRISDSSGELDDDVGAQASAKRPGKSRVRAVRGYATLYFQGTDVLIQDMCRFANGQQNLKVTVFSGAVVESGITVTRISGPTCGGTNALGSGDVAHRKLSTKVLQLLHVSAKGKFRTKGCYAAATVRG